jgi:ADP-ribose pyrophosphatase YjhB (NUDIX family)
MIKIHSADKTIYLTNQTSISKPADGTIVMNISTSGEMAEFYPVLINRKEIREIYFYNENESFLFEWFKSMFKIIEAAGGLVKNLKNEYLFIFRHNKWDLPKGKIEKGESIREAAKREVEEECGISGLSINREITPTFHTYLVNEIQVFKPTYWFEMNCSDTSLPVPQKEEGITEVRWIGKEDFETVRKNTYESIKDVIGELEN